MNSSGEVGCARRAIGKMLSEIAVMRGRFIIFLAKVPDQKFPLASGVASAAAGDMTEVLEGREFASSACSDIFI